MSASTVTIRRTLDARQRDVRTRILEAARQLIHDQGHETVGMELIAATAGVSRATMYRYFASKEHVVCDAALAWGHELASRIPSAIAAAGPANAIDVAIEQVVREAASDLPMVRATMTSVLALGPVADEFRLGVRGMFQALTAGAADELPAGLEASMTLLGRVFFADLALLSVGDIDIEQCIGELRTAAQRILLAETSGE
ncbi:MULTISPECIES: helix-turn-helix domain-containing protein [unclassified Mycobacterium]|uniref:TetR/AcrR family transcriptional regulator n=1 Tax=unclassified Mycobacterium TaxID=2642494 RepID=UPI0029C724BA|nr:MULTISPECIES: helix-turn-helix domain-containing protein [unclassified Mycobacterium]